MPSTTWKGFISFGLVSFPVSLFTAARDQTFSFHMLHSKDHSRVKQVLYCQSEDKPISRDEVVKGYEISKDEYVVVDPEELKKIAPPTAKLMEILEFVKASEVDPVYFDKSYHVAPDNNIVKPYVLLLKAMEETGYYGLAKVAMHNREHIVILRPSGKEMMLHTMFFANEIQAGQNVLDNAEELKDKELELAKQLVQTLASKFNPEQYHDEYQANVQKLIEQKQQGQAIVSAPQPKMAPVIDIFDALQRSLEQSGKKAPESAERKPPARATATKKKPAARKRGAA